MGKKKQKPKPRFTKIEGIIPSDADVEAGLTIKIGKDHVSIIDQNMNDIKSKDLRISSGYERVTKEKILSSVYGYDRGYDTNAINNALLKYDLLYAIDTNTIKTNQTFIHIAALIFVDIKQTSTNEVNGVTRYIQGFKWDVINGIPNPEQHAWVHGIKFIEDNISAFIQKKIGLIVDCDLGNLQSYNSGEKPIYDDYYLPPNISLIYASADAGQEFISNKAIRHADKIAKTLINDYSKDN